MVQRVVNHRATQECTERPGIMAKQLLFYEDVKPITKERHKDWSMQRGENFAFAADSNAVPLMCAEFQAAAADLPVVFGKNDGGYAPIVVLGIEPSKSLMVGKDGNWKGGYVPAFVRRYPFVFAEGEDKKTFTLCIDEGYDGCDAAGKKGERLYDDEGEPTQLLNTALEFAKNFEMESRKTQLFCKLLDEHGLFDPMQAGIKMPDGQTRAVTGFFVINKDRLKALSDEVVKDFFERDVLELIYYHMLSMRNMEKLRNLAG